MAELGDENHSHMISSDGDTIFLSPEESLEKIQSLDLESGISIRLKLKDLNSDWIFASAIKKDKGFEISFPDSDLDTTFYSDDDESCSLLSLDLWKCGWFALDSNNDNLTTLESCKQKGEGLPSFEFSGSSHKTNIDGVPFILYQAFSRTDVPFSAKCKDVVLDVTKQKPTLFFFAATPEGPNEQKMAFVYNLENEVPEIALLEQLGCADDHKKLLTRHKWQPTRRRWRSSCWKDNFLTWMPQIQNMQLL